MSPRCPFVGRPVHDPGETVGSRTTSWVRSFSSLRVDSILDYTFGEEVGKGGTWLNINYRTPVQRGAEVPSEHFGHPLRRHPSHRPIRRSKRQGRGNRETRTSSPLPRRRSRDRGVRQGKDVRSLGANRSDIKHRPRLRHDPTPRGDPYPSVSSVPEKDVTRVVGRLLKSSTVHVHVPHVLLVLLVPTTTTVRVGPMFRTFESAKGMRRGPGHPLRFRRPQGPQPP